MSFMFILSLHDVSGWWNKHTCVISGCTFKVWSSIHTYLTLSCTFVFNVYVRELSMWVVLICVAVFCVWHASLMSCGELCGIVGCFKYALKVWVASNDC